LFFRFSYKWFIVIILLLINILYLIKTSKSNINRVYNILLKLKHLENFSQAPIDLLGVRIFNIKLIGLIFIINFFRIISWFFPFSSHLFFSLTLSSIFWITRILFIFTNIIKTLNHIIPSNTPIILISIIRYIELIRILIRPITLRVRLSANITSGHLILRLIQTINSIPSFIFQLPLFILEIIVGIIQSYVFALLINLYLNDRF